MPKLIKGKMVSIGALAEETGASIAQVRFWTSLNLLKPSRKLDPTNPRSFFLYNKKRSIPRIKFIQAKKKERYKIKDIKEQIKKEKF